MVGPAVLYSIWKLMKKGNLSHEVAPRSVFYGHNFIEEAERSTGERVVGGWEGETRREGDHSSLNFPRHVTNALPSDALYRYRNAV